MNRQKNRYLKQWLAAAVILVLILTSAACGLKQLNKSQTDAPVSVIPPETSTDIQTENTAIFNGADSYQTIYRTLKELSQYELSCGTEESVVYETGQDGSANTNTVSESKAVTADVASSAESDRTFSGTNLQELDVDEADVLKTDGTYIYILKSGGKVQIVTADGADSELIGHITIPSPEETPEEMYIDNDTLNLITSSCESTMKAREKDVYETETKYLTKIYTYDITDRSNPKLLGSTKQEGCYATSRKNGTIIYLFSRYSPVLSGGSEEENYIPAVNDELLKATDICLPEYKAHTDYLVISSVDIKNPSKTIDEKAIISAADNYYVSADNIYIYTTDYSGSSIRTQLMRFHYADGKITAADAANLKGYINDSFSLNESDGFLRIVLTEVNKRTEINSLYVLDQNLNVCGSITDIAEGETVQSARFMEDIGYFVTFRNMDPLFSADLSDPKNPKILGELKVTGFSSYLHFYGENMLLGVGREIDEKTGEDYGLKLSMFDISDPADIKEVNKYVIKDTYDCSLLYNYKSVMIDPVKNVIGFCCDNKYLVFTYDKKEGFQNIFAKTLAGTDNKYYELAYNSFSDGYARGCYVKDTFYLIWDENLYMYDMSKEYKFLGKSKL